MTSRKFRLLTRYEDQEADDGFIFLPMLRENSPNHTSLSSFHVILRIQHPSVLFKTMAINNDNDVSYDSDDSVIEYDEDNTNDNNEKARESLTAPSKSEESVKDIENVVTRLAMVMD